jgi:glycogen operon protein
MKWEEPSWVLSWIDWGLLDTNAEIVNFYKEMIDFRKAHPVLRSSTHFENKDCVGSGYPDISWHGTKAWQVDLSDEKPILAFLLCGLHARGGTEEDDYIYVAMNMHWETHDFELPKLPEGMSWCIFANTDMQPPDDILRVGHEIVIENQSEFILGPRSVVILVGR